MGRSPSSRKEEIKQVAARLFKEKGYRATSMRDLAKTVGMEAASLYNHINSKQEILQELLMHIALRFTDAINEIIQLDISSLNKLERIIGVHVSLTIEFSHSMSIITSEWVHLEQPFLDEYKDLRKSYELKFRSLIEHCMQEGDFVQLDSELALFSMLSTLRWLYSWYDADNPLGKDELEEQMIHCLIKGLLVRA